mgnify:CR=1 FL=1
MMFQNARVNQLPFPAFVVIGNIVPILYGAREVTSFFYDDIHVDLDRAGFDLVTQGKLDLERIVALERRLINSLQSESRKILSDRRVNRAVRNMLELQESLDKLPFSGLYRQELSDLEINVANMPYIVPGTTKMVPRRYFSREKLDIGTMVDLNVRQAKSQGQISFDEDCG